jgi:acyl-CoA thioesterase-1
MLSPSHLYWLARGPARFLLLLLLWIAGCQGEARSGMQTQPGARNTEPAVAPQVPSQASAGSVDANAGAREPLVEARAGAREPLKVVFLGDSLSAGAHLPAAQAFPAVLQRKLQAEGVAFELANAGVTGDTSAGGLRRIDWILRQNPALVVVELGANDGLRGVPVASIEQNLRSILAKIKAQGARAMLLGMRLPPSIGADYARAFEEIYPRLAAELGLAYVPFFMEGVAGVPELNLPDGLHPTAQGHERIADRLREPVRQALLPLKPIAQ